MNPQITRTQNPLPFEQLESKRFEDLVRQLAYGFKNWRSLEATGRTGSDGGFDSRGYEIVDSGQVISSDIDDEDSPEDAVTSSDRLWLIQCKREKSITPAKMKQHLADIHESSKSGLYGILFAAACDFSLATRNVVRDWARENGLSECIIWGKGELEDLLFQPKNDGALFVYFGISLKIRQQAVTATLRKEISIKRKLMRALEKANDYQKTIILVDPDDENYPFAEEGKSLKESKSRWKPIKTSGLGFKGVRVMHREFWAFFDWSTGYWDIASAINFATPSGDKINPWHDLQVEDDYDSKKSRIVDFWRKLPEQSQVFMCLEGSLLYSEIIDIDPVGNDYLTSPVAYVCFVYGCPPYRGDWRFWFRDSGSRYRQGEFDPSKHAKVFPDELRDLEWEKSFFADMGVVRAEQPYIMESVEKVNQAL